MTDTRFAQTEEFEAQQQAWYKAVAKVFARVRKQDVSDIPLDIWRKLIRTTYDGINVNPLYNRVDELAEVALPGVFPFTRGACGAGTEEGVGWGVTESFGPSASNEQLLSALDNGTTDIVIYGADNVEKLLKECSSSTPRYGLTLVNPLLAWRRNSTSLLTLRMRTLS